MADTAGAVDAADSVKSYWGTDNDLQIFHDGANNHIYAASTPLYLTGLNAYLRPKNGEQGVTVIADGAAELYHNNTKKAATSANGLDVTGTIGATTVDLGDWTLTESSGKLIFQYQGTTKFSMDSGGTLSVANDVETDATF